MMAGSATHRRTMTSFLPVSTRDLAECERHYRTVHLPYARRVLLGMPHVLTYNVMRVLRERDIAGGWNAPHTAWRWVSLRFVGDRGLELTPAQANTIAQDHRRLLRDLRPAVVREDVVIDRLAGQTTLASYLIDIAPDAGGRDGRVRLAEISDALAVVAGDAPGIRRLTVNTIEAEHRSEPIDEPGQRSTGQLLDVPTRLGYVELHADSRHWGDRFFADRGVAAALDEAGASGGLAVRHVEEYCGFDRR